MDRQVKDDLLAANKLIFVKRYEDAEAMIEKIIVSKEGRNEVLVHLRRIELATMLGKLQNLREAYLEDLRKGRALQVTELCIAIVEQHGDMVPPNESVERFQQLIRTYGPTAAAHYGIAFSMEQLENLDRAVLNYEESLKISPDWYPSFFGLSQVWYQRGDDKRGDQYFFQFEQAAPYNVYGNFETHRILSQEFFEREHYSEAEAAINALSTWWIENKERCPVEISIFEKLSMAKIGIARGKNTEAEEHKVNARTLAQSLLDNDKSEEGVLYFVAKVLEEFGEKNLALAFYRRILRRTGRNPALVQKIGGQFLSQGEFDIAQELFADAYEVNPDHPEVRFCYLVAKLKNAGVNVEEYLIGRERLRQLIESQGDRVELLALLHSLLAKFQEDPDVQGHVGDIYLKLGNPTRAESHFRKMFALDGRSRPAALKFAAFMMQHGDADEAMAVLNNMVPAADAKSVNSSEDTEISWLKANYFARKQDFRASEEILKRAVSADPWNVSYLLQEAINLQNLVEVNGEKFGIDQPLHFLNAGKETEVVWKEFERRTQELDRAYAYEAAYVRRKIHFLYTNGEGETLRAMVGAASRFDSARGTYDIIRLLNTNFDGASLYWALGILFKDLWQLETACMWFEQALLYPGLDKITERRTYLELADCYVWRNMNMTKALEYAKLSLDLGERAGNRALTILAHGFLRSGQVRQAQVYLEQNPGDIDFEVSYLQGLLHYRNGSPQKAKQVWKPLLSVRTENLRDHNIKQEILRYYFEGTPYLRAN